MGSEQPLAPLLNPLFLLRALRDSVVNPRLAAVLPRSQLCLPATTVQNGSN